MAAISTLLAGVLGWAFARRYGRRRALAVPLLALVSTAILMWRVYGLEVPDAMVAVAVIVAVAGPAVAGALVGIALGARRG